ncbi:uncharacterized protein [Embiotoca jacksoni]|uniref:uncharacterized protein isoform X1 n=1 Tax=Embiotoca jacksoni TaxID=100190 RepID=UPI0037039D41
MAAFKWSQMSLFLVLMLQFTATAGQHLSLFTIKGHDVTLPCENVIPGQHNCDITNWLFTNSNRRPEVELIKLGQIGLNVGSKSDRLSVTSNCSLVIKNVTDEDVGVYTCRQFKPGQRETDFDINLSVVKIIDYEEDETVTLDCSVLTYGQCRYTVEWVNTSPDMMTSSYQCSTSVKFTTSHVDQKSEFYKLLKCKVRHVDTKEEKLFSFSHQTSDEDSTKTTIRPTIQPTATKEINTSPGLSWWYITVLVALAALLIILVAVVIWKKNKRNKTQKEENTVLSLNPVETSSGPEEHQVTVDAEEGVSYASISYSRKDDRKARVRDDQKEEDEGDSVTYSTVKASSAGVSSDPGNLYASVNEPNK